MLAFLGYFWLFYDAKLSRELRSRQFVASILKNSLNFIKLFAFPHGWVVAEKMWNICYIIYKRCPSMTKLKLNKKESYRPKSHFFLEASPTSIEWQSSKLSWRWNSIIIITFNAIHFTIRDMKKRQGEVKSLWDSAWLGQWKLQLTRSVITNECQLFGCGGIAN